MVTGVIGSGHDKARAPGVRARAEDRWTYLDGSGSLQSTFGLAPM